MLHSLGRVAATAAVAASVPEAVIIGLLDRHVARHWGDLNAEDKAANDSDHSYAEGRIFSCYDTEDHGTHWVITEDLRGEGGGPTTTVLFPGDYRFAVVWLGLQPLKAPCCCWSWMHSGDWEGLNKGPLERVTPLFGHAGNRQRPGGCCDAKATRGGTGSSALQQPAQQGQSDDQPDAGVPQPGGAFGQPLMPGRQRIAPLLQRQQS